MTENIWLEIVLKKNRYFNVKKISKEENKRNFTLCAGRLAGY